MAKVMEAFIAKGASTRHPLEQKEVAFGIASISSKEEIHRYLIKKGGIRSLITILTQSHNLEAQRLAALGIANCTSCTAMRNRIVDDGGLETTLNYIKSEYNDPVVRGYCAMAIGNLAEEAENQEDIEELGGIEALVALLECEDTESAGYAAFAISNLAVNPKCREYLVREGVCPLLVSLACCEEISAQSKALAALQRIFITPEYRVLCVREGVLDPLVLLARADDIELLREVTRTISCLSLMEENKYEIANRAMSNIIFLLMYGDPEVEQHACSAMANLLEVPELHKQFLEEKGLNPLLAIYKSGDWDSRTEAARAIANLAAIPDMQQTVLMEGVIYSIVELLSAGGSYCQRFSCILLANLATTVESQINIVQGGGIQPIVNILGAVGADIEARRYAALTLANLSATLSFHSAILTSGALQALFSLSNSPDIKSQYYIASTLTNLSSNTSNHSFIVQEGGLQSIILLCYSTDPSVHQQAILAIQGLSNSDNVRMKIVQEGGLDPLCQLLTNEDVEILRGACTSLCNLSLADENKYEIANCGVLPGLIMCLASEDMQIASQAAATLANLAQIPENRILVAREGGILSAITAMRSMYLEVQRGAGRLLANLCASVELMQSIVEAEGHQLFISYLLSQDVTCQRMGALGLSNLCTHSQYCTTIMTSGALEPLCSFLRAGDAQVDVQRYAIIAIANLASNFENHDGLVENGILTLLTLLSSLTEAEIRQYAAFALVKLGQNSKYRQRVTDEGGLDPVLYLARTDEPEVQRETLACICSLSFAEENKVAMAKYGGIAPIVNGLGAPDRDTARMACCAAANLSEMIENTDNVVSAGAIPGLVVALGRVEPEVTREAARAIGNICANMKHVDAVLNEGGLPFLIDSIRSLDTQLQCMSSMALCNISSDLSNQSKLLSAGLLDPILHTVKASLDSKYKGNFEMIRYSLLIISNIAVYKEHHEKLVGDVLEVLTAYTKHRDIKTRQFATLALGNLCTNPDNLEVVAQNGLLKTIISNAFPSSTDTTVTIQMQALSAIRGLSTHPLLCLQLVRDGCLEPLILAAKSAVRDVQSEVAAAFSNLSEAEGNKVAMARNGIFPALHHLCNCNDMETVSYTVCTLANLAEMVEGRTQKLIIDDGFVKATLQLVNTRHIATRREGARFFALLASKRGSQDAVMQDEVLQALLLFLGSKRDHVERRFGALAVGNLTTVTKNHSTLFETGIVQCLIGVSEVEDPETRRCVAFIFHNLASHEPNHHLCGSMGLLKPLVRLLGDTDCDVVLHASFATRQLSLSARCRLQFLDFDGLQALLKLSSCKEVETLREVSATLRNISLSEQVKIELCQKGGLPILIELIHCPDIEIVHQATGAVANLAEVIESQGIMLDAGILQHLKFAMRFMSTDVQREAIRGVANLSTAYTYVCEISGSGVLAPLVAMLSSPDFLSQRYAAMGVGNLATYPINQEKILSEGALQPLLSLAHQENGDLESQRYAVFAITNISAAKETHSILIDANIMNLIMPLLDADDLEVRNSVYICLANLASSPDNRAALLDGGSILSHLMAVVNDSEDDCGALLYAVSALRGLAIDESIGHDLVKQDVLPSLLRLAQSSDIHIQSEVLGCLCNLSLSGCIGDNPTAFLQAVNTQNLVTFLCSADVTCQLFGAVTLGNIASEQALQEPLMSGGVLDPLVTVAQSADLETQRCIAYAICNLAVGVQYRKAIINAGGLLSIVSLACSNDLKDQFAGISTLRAISADPCSSRAVVEAGALKALVAAGGPFQTTQIGEEEVKTAEINENSVFARLASREAMHSMCTLSLHELNKIQVVMEALPRLVNEILQERGQDEECRLYALGTLANLSENEKMHVELLRAGVAQAVISTVSSGQISKMGWNSSTSTVNNNLSSNNPWLIHEAARTVANLLSSLASVYWLKDNGDIYQIGHGIATLLAVNDPTTRHFAAIAASNLRYAFVESAPLLVELIGQPTTTTCNFKRRDSSISLEDNIIDMAMFELDHHGSHRENPAPPGNDDCNVHCYAACLALAQIAGHDEGRRHLLSDSLGPECLANLCNCIAMYNDERITFNAVFALNRLAEDPLPESKTLMGSLVIPVVAGLLKGIEDQQHHDTVGQLIAILKRLCITPENALTAISEGILEPIYTKLDCMKSFEWCEITGESNSEEDTSPIKKLEFAIAQEAIGLLDVLSSHEICKSAIAYHKILVPLLSILQCDNTKCVYNSCSIIANCAEDMRTHKTLFEHGFGRTMLHLMRSKHVVLHGEAGRAISNLMSSDEGILEWQEEEMGIGSTLSLANSTDIKCKCSAALILRKACANATSRKILGNANIGISTVLAMTNSMSPDTCIQAALTLRELASDPDFKAKIISEGGAKNAVALARSSVIQLRSTGLSIIRHLSLSILAKRVLVEAEALEVIINAQTEIEECSEIVASLAEDTKNQLTLIEGKVMPFMLHILDVANQKRADGGIAVKINAARVYASISSNLNCCQRSEFEGPASISAILNLLSSTEELIITFAATALGNLAVNSNFHHFILCERGLKTLVSVLGSQFSTCRRAAARAVSRLAASPANQSIILAAGVMPYLLKLLPSVGEEGFHDRSDGAGKLDTAILNPNKTLILHGGSDPKSVEEDVIHYAALAVGNLSSCDGYKYSIASTESILSLVRILSEGVIGGGIKAREYAAMALSNLSSLEDNQLSIIKIGGLVTLVAGALDIPPRRIHNYTELPSGEEHPPRLKMDPLIPKQNNPSSAENREQQPSEGGELCQNNIQLYCCIALSNIATQPLNQITLVDSGTVHVFCRNMAEKERIETQRVCGLALFNLSCTPQMLQALVRAGALSAVQTLARSPDVDCRRYAAMILGNLTVATEPVYDSTLRGGVLQAALRLSHDLDDKCRMYASLVLCNMAKNDQMAVQIPIHGGIKTLLDMACPDSTLNTLFATMALVNLTTNESNAAMSGSEILKAIIRLASPLQEQSESDQNINNVTCGATESEATLSGCRIHQDLLKHHCQDFARFTIANMASNRDCLDEIKNQGGVTPLLGLAASASVGAQCLAITALRHLSSIPGNTMFLIKAGILDVLVIAGENDAGLSKTKMEVSACICHLSLNHESKIIVVNQCVHILIKLVLSWDLDTSRHAIGALANVSENAETHHILAKGGVVEVLITLIQRQNLCVYRDAARTICNLLSSLEHQSAFVEFGLESLTTLSSSPDNECRYYIALSFRKLSPNLSAQRSIKYGGGFKVLVSLLMVEDFKIRRLTAEVLRDICVHPEHKEDISKEGGLEAVVSLASDKEKELRALAFASLRHLSACNVLKRPCVLAGCLQPILSHRRWIEEDIKCQVAGTLANLSENVENQISIVEQGGVQVLASLARTCNDEVQQDSARSLANLCMNEPIHSALYHLGGIHALIALTESKVDICQRYALIGLRFLSSTPEVRELIIKDGLVSSFLTLAKSSCLEYQRHASVALASFSLSDTNKKQLVQDGALQYIINLCASEDQEIMRSSVFALSNLADSPEIQWEIINSGGIETLKTLAKHNNTQVQRDTARAFASLSCSDEGCTAVVKSRGIQSLFSLARSSDLVSQRYSTLALCNIVCGEHKAHVFDEDLEVQRYTSLALTGLCLKGKSGLDDSNRDRIIGAGILNPLMDLVRFPQVEVQLCATLAVNAIAIGEGNLYKSIFMAEDYLWRILCVIQPKENGSTYRSRSDDVQQSSAVLHTTVYALGSLSEDNKVLARLLGLGALSMTVSLLESNKSCCLETKRAAGYFLAILCQQRELHDMIVEARGAEAVVSLAQLADEECQEYASFSLAHLASNDDLKVRLVQLGALAPLIAMAEMETQPQQYAGIALLKLADNFENHARIAEEGGIQTLLWLGRSRNTHQELQYKAALTVGSLASQAAAPGKKKFHHMPPP